MHRGIVAIDEGQISDFAQRILRGEVIYRDFYTGIFPGIYYICAMLYALLGQDLFVARVAQLAINATLAALIHRIALRVATPAWAGAVALAYFPLVIVSFPTLTMLSYSPLAMLAALAALLTIFRFLSSGRRSTIFLAGILLALCGLTKQNYGGFAVLSVALTLLAARFRGVLPLPLRRTLLLLGLAGLATTALLLGPLVWQGAGPRFLRYTITTLLNSQLSSFHQPLPPLLQAAPPQDGLFLFFYLPSALFSYVLRGGSPVGISLSESVRWAVIWMGYGGSILVLAAGCLASMIALRSDHPREWTQKAGVTISALLLFLGLFPSAIWSHLATVAPPVLVVAAFAGSQLSRSCLGTSGVRVANAAAMLLAVTAFGVSIRVAADIRSWHPVPLRLPKASLWVGEQDAELLRGAVAFLSSCAGSDGYAFVAPDLPVLYFLTGLSNPTPYDMLIPGDIEPDLLIRRLEENRTRCIVYNPNMYAHFEPLGNYLPTFVDYLHENFVVTTTIGAMPRQWLGMTRSEN